MWVLIPYAVALLVILGGIAVHRWRASSWLLTEGRIEKIEEAYFPNERKRRGSTYDKRPKGKRFSIRVEYSFKVEGERYGGYLGLWGFDEKDFAEFGGYFRSGSALFVRYNAKGPDESEVRLKDNARMQYYGIHTVLRDASPPEPDRLP